MNDDDLRELAAKAHAVFESMTPSEKLRHHYMQRRSFVRGMAPWKADFDLYRQELDRYLPDEKSLTDAEIGLALVGMLPLRV